MSQKTNETDLVYAEAYKHLLEQLSSELKKNNIDVTPDILPVSLLWLWNS